MKRTRVQHFLIDPIDADLCVRPWYYDKDGYITNTIKCSGKTINRCLHREILSRALNRKLQSHDICDHINRNRSDNRRSNLRCVTPSQNGQNNKRSNPNGYKNVCHRTNRDGSDRWEVNVYVNRARIYVGAFRTIEEAAGAARAKRTELNSFYQEPPHA